MSQQSFAKFWVGIHRLLPVPQVPDAWVEMRTPDVGAAVVEVGLMATAPIWQTPNTVADYFPSDFEFLGAEDCGRLSKFVEDFRAAVTQPDGSGPRARGAIVGILALFEFDRFYDPIAFQVGKQIESRLGTAGRPKQLAKLKFATGEDGNGNPALWVWAFLTDEEDADFLARARDVRELLDEAARSVAPDHWPYVRFRSEDEQAELEHEREQLQRQEAT